MRVLFINRFFYPDLSATAQILTELAEDLDARGETVTVITGRTRYDDAGQTLPWRDNHKGIRIRRVGATGFSRHRVAGRLADFLFFCVAALWTAIRHKRLDCVVVMSDPPFLSLLAVLIKTLKGTKTIQWMQDVFPEIAVRSGVLPDGLPARLLARLAAWGTRRSDRTVVIGRCMARRLTQQGIPSEKIALIPNWADGEALWPLETTENPFSSRQGLAGRFVVLYSGNLGRVHELETVCRLIDRTRDWPDLGFCLVGGGFYRPDLEAQSARQRWPHVLFLPYEPKERLPFSLAAADVHLITLRADMAGLSVPSKLYAAMAAARPILFIGPEESEAAYVVREAGCGSVVPPGDSEAAVSALRALYENASLREEMGQAGRTYFERHCDRPIATRRFWQVLRELSAS